MNAVTAFAPGTVANLGPGLDVLGLAVEGAGDEVRICRQPGGRVTVEVVGSDEIPRDPKRNSAGVAALEVVRRAGKVDQGLAIEVRKGLPLAGGQGGSAASAVAAAVAADALLGACLARAEILAAALAAEEAVAGKHADNAAAALFGGVVLIRALEPLDAVRVAYPRSLRVVIVKPAQGLQTREARRVLPASVDRATAVAQAAQVGALIAALASGDFELLTRAVEDRIAEPARVPLLPGFAEAKRAALEAGARGCSISGAGPSAFAFAEDERSGERIAQAMVSAYRRKKIEAQARVCAVDDRGARVVREEP